MVNTTHVRESYTHSKENMSDYIPIQIMYPQKWMGEARYVMVQPAGQQNLEKVDVFPSSWVAFPLLLFIDSDSENKYFVRWLM